MAGRTGEGETGRIQAERRSRYTGLREHGVRHRKIDGFSYAEIRKESLPGELRTIVRLNEGRGIQTVFVLDDIRFEAEIDGRSVRGKARGFAENGTVYVKVNNTFTAEQINGHESFHVEAERYPEAYARLQAEVARVVPRDMMKAIYDQYQKGYRQVYGESKISELAKEEIFADIAGGMNALSKIPEVRAAVENYLRTIYGRKVERTIRRGMEKSTRYSGAQEDGAGQPIDWTSESAEKLSDSRNAAEIIGLSERDGPPDQAMVQSVIAFRDIPEQAKRQAEQALNGNGDWLALDADTRKALTEPDNLTGINQYFGLNLPESALRNKIQNAFYERWLETSGAGQAVREIAQPGDLVQKGYPPESAGYIMELWQAGVIETVYEVPPEVANMRWTFAGLNRPPCSANAPVLQVRLKQDVRLVRYYDGDISSVKGNWAMFERHTEGLSMRQIKNKFALPNLPTQKCEVYLQAGDMIELSIAGRLDWGAGGGLQVDFMNEYAGRFVELQG